MPSLQLNSKINLDLSSVDVSNLPTRDFLIFTAVFLVGMMLFIFQVIVPDFQKIGTNRRELASLESRLKVYQQKAEQIDAVVSSQEYSRAAIVDRILPSDNPFLDILATINDVANQHAITIRQLSYTPGIVDASSSARLTTTNSRFKTDQESYNISLNAEGTYNDIVAFLHELELHTPFNTVSQSKISNLLSNRATVNFEIIVNYHQPRASANLDQAIPELTSSIQETLAQLNEFTINPIVSSQIQLNVGDEIKLFQSAAPAAPPPDASPEATTASNDSSVPETTAEADIRT